MGISDDRADCGPRPPGHRIATLFLTCAAITTFASVGCGRGDRNTATVDSAVVHAKARNDSASVYTVPPPTDTLGRGTSTPTISFPQPATILAADSSAGQRLYRREGSCIPCHGARAEGVTRLGSNISDQEWVRGDGALTFLFAIIRDGVADPGASRSPMPGKGEQLTKQQIFQIAAYVYTLSHAGSTVPDSTALPAGAPPIAKLPPDTALHTSEGASVSVIPAKAGTHVRPTWIPAFAGMTNHDRN